MNTNAQSSAFPYILTDEDNSKDTDFQPGLTKREYFAAMAMQGMLANKDAGNPTKDGRAPIELIVEASVKIAGALLAELEKK